MTHEWARNEIGRVADAMLSGATSFIEGARKLSGLRFSANLEQDPDLVPFVAIDSETDELPIGEVRKLWSADALERFQPKIARAEEWARQVGYSHCEQLAKRFGGL